MLKSFLSYYKPYKLTMLLLVIGSLFRSLLELCFPYAVKQLIEQELPNKDLTQLFSWCSLLGLLYLGNFVLMYTISYFGLLLSAKMENDMRRDLFLHLQKLSFRFYDQNKSGNLLSRLTNDLGEIGELACRAPNDLIVCAFTMLGTMLILLIMNPILGSLIAFLLLFKTFHTIFINQKMKQSFFANRVTMGNMTAKAAESINGIRLIKAFAAEPNDYKEFMAKAKAYLDSKATTYGIRSYFVGSIIFFSNFINVALLLAGGYMIHQSTLTVGELIAFLLYVNSFMKPLMQLLGFSEMYQKGMAGYKRFYEILQEKPDIIDQNNSIELKNCKGAITFEKVSFSYDQNHEILNALNLSIKPGETIAFVGATGAGKTTIANLLLRFYEPQKGRILVDGIDIKRYTQCSLRKQIGLVQQEVFLFSGSVQHNIAFAKPKASLEEIRQAAKSAAADSFIEQLPRGFDTDIGERGVKLSGGQKQRLAIARVFLKNPPIVVLDEATSALDNETEQQIQNELDKLSQGRTTLIIAHRLSTIKHADKIVVLENGSVVEAGTHDELLAQQGVYHRLYNLQYK